MVLPLSVIITAWKEPETVSRMLDALKRDVLPRHEVLVVAPDEETLDVARRKKKTYSSIRAIKDNGEGKPAALQMGANLARGEVLIFSDGDVIIGEQACSLLYARFRDKRMGAVSGRPVSRNARADMFGYWGYVLSMTAHKRRLTAVRARKRFFCSGYLFGIRKKLFPSLTQDILSEDGYISHQVYEQGYRIGYEPRAQVYVKYPTMFKDWIAQKRRSAGGYTQMRDRFGIEIRSFRSEAFGGVGPLQYISSITEAMWLVALYLARVYLWWRIYRDVHVRSKSHRELWTRIETTK